MNELSTSFSELHVPPSGRMSLKLIRITRLKQFAALRGLEGPVSIGEAIGKKANQTSDLLSGKASFGEKVAESIERFAGLPDKWLDSLGDEKNTTIKTATDTVKISSHNRQKNRPQELVIPQFETGGGMNNGGLVLEDQPGVIKSWHVDEEWLRLNVKNHTGVKNLCIVTGFGPSMRPMFNPGDPLLVDRGVTTVDTDAVYFFRIGDAGYVKTLQRIPDLVGDGKIIRAKSKNPDFDPFDILPSNPHFQVLGKVLTVWKSEQF